MNWRRTIVIVAVLAIIALAVLKLKNNKEVRQREVYQYDKEQTIHVQADTLKEENVSAEFSYSGTFEPNKETRISAEIQGKINGVLVDAGSIVKKGQALIQLDNSIMKLQLQSIEIQIEELEADVSRYAILARADAIQGVQLEKAMSGLKSSQVQKATLLEQINKTTIRAPFSGIVTAKLSEEGAFAVPGVPLLQITDIAKLKFTVNVPENDLDKFKLNQIHPITVDAYPEISVLGKTIMIGSKANTGSIFPVQFLADNTSDLKIKSGMFGKVILKNIDEAKAIIIPSAVIVGSEKLPQVYQVKNGKAHLQNITISGRLKNSVVVSGGLQAGDVIITNGFVNLFDQANVIVK